MKGLLITFEGGEGSGKTTVSNEIMKRLAQSQIPCLYSREPGGIPIAEKIREVILNPDHTEMDSRTEALLYAAARRQHLIEKIIPALKEGKVVLCDRFIDSSVVYQGFARQIGEAEIWELNQFATEGILPDLTLFFDILPTEGLNRIAVDSNRKVDRLDLESLAFHENVYQGYLAQLGRYPERIKRVDASQTLEQVVETVYQKIMEKINRE